jgi:signal transduction histidine kinase
MRWFPPRWLLAVPVSVKVMGIAVGLTVLFGATMFWQIHETWHGIARRDLEAAGQAIARDLAIGAAAALRSGDRARVQLLVEGLHHRSPELAYVIVLDANGRVVAETVPGEPPERLLEANRLDSGVRSRVVALETAGGAVRDVAVAVGEGRSGVVRIGMSESRISYEVEWLTRRVGSVTAVVAGVGIAAAWLLTYLITRPLSELVSVARAVEGGRYDVRATVWARDDIGELAHSFNELAVTLDRAEARRKTLQRQVLSASEEERKRVARELHDHVGQALTSILAELSVLITATRDVTQARRVAALCDLTSQTLGDVHAISTTLRPSVLDDQGLIAALTRHCERFAAHAGVEVEFQVIGLDSGRRLAAEIETALYRIVQESLTNAARHGHARTVHVMVQAKEHSVLAVVDDDGRGFDADNWHHRCVQDGHLGLLGIEERAALLGGTLRVQSSPGSGTSLFVEVPKRYADGA